MKPAASTPAFPLEPALDFLQHLWALNHALERRSLLMVRTVGVTAQQRLFIRCIGKYPGVTASDLAGVLHLDRGTVSVGLSRLARKRLVVGRRAAGDKRRVALWLTPKGKSLAAPDPRTVEFAVNRLLKEVGPANIARTKSVLRRLSKELTSKLAPG